MKKIYQNPLIAIFICIFVILLGIKNYLDLPVALYPNTSKPKIGAHLDFNNIGVEDFRERYGKKIEAALSAIEDVTSVEGNYFNDRVRYSVHFSWNTEEKKAKLDVRMVLSGLSQGFPESWEDFHVYNDGSQNSNLYIALTSDEHSRKELHTLLKDRVLSELQSIDGLEEANFWLPEGAYIRIELQASLMETHGVSPKHIKEALMKKRYDLNLGELKLGGSRLDIVVPLKERSLQEIKETLVKTEKGESFRIEDFAQVSFEVRNFDNLIRANGESALIAYGSVKPTGNISYVASEYIKRLSKSVQEISPDIKMNTLLNPSRFIETAVRNVFVAIGLGILIATLIIFLFLGSFSQTLVVAVSIPMSVIGGFTLMSLLGIEVNLISLGALALSVGMVVDGAIVVLENVSRHLSLKKPRTFKERIELIWESVGEVRQAVVASLLTTIIVFAPLSFTAPIANALLGDLARVMVCVLVISVLVTLYLIPPLLLLFPSPKEQTESDSFSVTRSFSKFVVFLREKYLAALRYFMNHRVVTNLVFFLLFGLLVLSAYILLNHVKREIVATPDTDKVWLNISHQEENLELEVLEKYVVDEVESVVEKEVKPYISHYFTQIHERYGASILFTLKDKSLQDEFKEKLETLFVNTARVRYNIYMWNPTSLEIPREPLFDIIVAGSDSKKNRETLQELDGVFDELEDVGYVDLDPNPRVRRYFEFKFHEEKIRRVEKATGSSLYDDLSSSIGPYVSDSPLYDLHIGEREYPIRMVYPKGSIKNIEDFKNLMFKIKGKYYPLRHFAHFSEKKEDAQYFTKEGRLLYRAKVFPKESYKGGLDDLREVALKKIEESEKVSLKDLSFLETGKEINESLRSLLDSFVLALFLILLVLVLQFGYFKQTFIIMMAIPLGFIGVAFSLYMFSSTLSLNSMLGLILLSGTAVNNSILLTDFFNRLNISRSREELQNAILQASSLRLRPILITTLTTILGMLPIAFAFDAGGKVLQPLGVSVCGGLGVSTFFTLFVIPIVLYRVEGRKWS